MNRYGVPDPRQHASSASGPDGHFSGKPPLSSIGPNFDGRRIVQRHELIASGMSGRAITEAVRTRSLLRVRRDHYALPDTDVHTLEAVSYTHLTLPTNREV